MPRIAFIAALALLAAASQAFPDETFTVCTKEPRVKWMSVAAITIRAQAAGYRDVRHIETSGSCYQIDALTGRHQHADIVMDPVSGDIVSARIAN